MRGGWSLRVAFVRGRNVGEGMASRAHQRRRWPSSCEALAPGEDHTKRNEPLAYLSRSKSTKMSPISESAQRCALGFWKACIPLALGERDSGTERSLWNVAARQFYHFCYQLAISGGLNSSQVTINQRLPHLFGKSPGVSDRFADT